MRTSTYKKKAYIYLDLYDYDRDNLLHTKKDLIYFSKFIDNDSKRILTNHSIQINGINLDDISSNNLVSDFGPISYKMKSFSEFNNHEILFFHYDSVNFNYLTQIHLIDNQFLFAANKLSSTRAIDSNDILDINNSILSMYKILTPVSETCDLSIQDQKGNTLVMQYNIDHYSYFIPNNQVFNRLVGKIKNHQTKTKLENNIRVQSKKWVLD